MILIEAESFKIDLVNDLNNQRASGINCDIEIESAFSLCKIYSHSIILNLFSDILRSFVEDRMKMTASMSVCKITFPHEVDFIKTDCFDCFKQVIDYFYAGELNIEPQHESHLKNIVYGLKIERLIQLLFSSLEDNDTLSDSRTLDLCDNSILDGGQHSTNIQSIPTSYCEKRVNIEEELNSKNTPVELKNLDANTNSKSFAVVSQSHGKNETDSNKGTKTIVQSPPKKRIKANYENTTSYPNTCSIISKRDNKRSGEIHSDGLHLLLSILEEENRKEFLAPESNLHRTSEKCTNEVNHSQQQDNSTEEIIVKNTKTDRIPLISLDMHGRKVEGKDPQESIIYQALISKQHRQDQDTNTNVESSTLSNNKNETTENGKHENSRKKKKVDKNKGSAVRKKSLKKNENLDKVIGVQDGYMCKKCKMFFDNLSSLQEHIQSTHSKKFRCIACNFMTIKIRYFIDHLIQNRHEGTICSICHFQTSTNEELQRHIIKHEQNLPKPFFCNDCDKTFPTRRSWSVHLPVHSYETQFLCAVCSKGFKWSQGLQNHMSTHVNEKMYPCSQCSFLTASRANLAKHILKHETKKEVCPYEECKFREIRKENLKAHLLTHSKEKRFQCELCGKSFAHARNLDRHLESVHNPQKLELGCNQCSYVSVRLDKLKDHFKCSHKSYDYTQYLGKLKEDMKTRSLLGARVNRHVLANTKQINIDSHVHHRFGDTESVTGHPIVNNQTSILTLPVLNQDLFRVGNIDSCTVPIIMNVNQVSANLMRPLLQSKLPGATPNVSAIPVRNVVGTKSKQSTEKTKPADKDQKASEKDRKTNEKNRKKNRPKSVVNNFNSGAPKKILPLIKTPQNAVLTNAPIFLILSSPAVQSQVLTKPDANLNQNPGESQPMRAFLTNQTPQVIGKGLANTNTLRNGDDKDAAKRNAGAPGTNVDSGHTSEPHSILKNDLCYSDNNLESQQKLQTERVSNDQAGSLIPNPSYVKSAPDTDHSPGGNYIDVLDESTGELLLLTSKHINNPFLDEATGELSVFEIPSSFINYIENLTGSSDYDTILPEPAPSETGDDLADYYRDESFPLLFNDKQTAFILDELTGELNVTTKR